MTKKIAVINDLSGFGRCSLTAAISVIAAMGVQPCPMPTAVLSAQTGYPSYFCDDYTDKMENFRQEWEKMDAQFDGIYTGFVASEHQIENIFTFLKTFQRKNTFLSRLFGLGTRATEKGNRRKYLAGGQSGYSFAHG